MDHSTDIVICQKCNQKLVGCRYIQKEDKDYCMPCFEKFFSHTCQECGLTIGPDHKDLYYKDQHWHESCFRCHSCHKSLAEQPFITKDEHAFCSDCFDNNFAARCDGCRQPFRGGMKKFEYRGKQWHDQCFTCLECHQPIGASSFIPRDDSVICIPCHETKYAQRCTKCRGVIQKGGISYKESPWHRECFTCTNCGKELAGEKFTSKDEKPYCGDCHADLFANRCCQCSKAITGINGAKYISFEERHWHSNCFNCHKCQTSLVGKGFLVNGLDIVCPQCDQ